MDGAAAPSRGRAHAARLSDHQGAREGRAIELAAGPAGRTGGIAATPIGPLVARAQVRHDAPDAMARLRAALGPAPLDLALLFATPEADPARLAQSAARAFGDTPVMGCTTAGEIGARGYAEGEIVALGLPRAHFQSLVLPIEGLSRLDPGGVAGAVAAARARLAGEAPHLAEGFAFLLVDGLSTAEDALAHAVAAGLGGEGAMPLVGGSAGDGGRYRRTFVIHGGRAMADAAVLALVRTRARVRAFQTDHLTPTNIRMVVTGADPERRVVTEINAEPAAREYARLLGRDAADLTPYTFAAHPLVVRAGGRHHVRAIQRIEGDDLVFFSAIDEGLVLTLARTHDMLAHLRRALAALSQEGQAPEAILACDCLLRRIEAEERQLGGSLSAVLARHRVVGFSTYGEQMGAMHVNQTLTGLAFYAPEPEGEGR